MKRPPDGAWFWQVPSSRRRRECEFLTDGKPVPDPHDLWLIPPAFVCDFALTAVLCIRIVDTTGVANQG
jgi:hypothetical protein